LLKFGINPNIRDNRSEAALHLAAENGSTELAEVLLKHGADIKGNGLTEINCLYNKENLKCNPPKVRDGKGKTPLMVAARGNYVTIVDMIIKAERCQLL
jgi:ankyrin repeat protein